MTTNGAEYELVLMLDPEAEDERRDEIAAEARKRIESGGNLKADKPWGMRKLAYEIRQRTEADYRFFRFETGDRLLDELDHSLKIADGVLRFRIFKVDPDSPVVEPPPPVALASATSPRGGRGGPGGRPPRAQEPPPAQAPPAGESPAEPPGEEPPAEAPAEEPPAEAPAEEPPAEAPAEEPPAETPAAQDE